MVHCERQKTCIAKQVGNTSSRKITEVKQLGPRLAPGWVLGNNARVGLGWCIATNTVKSPLYASGAKKNSYYTTEKKKTSF